MKFQTKNELEHFEFSEVYVSGVEYTKDMFHMLLDNVKILPENSCNRDIRTMRTNGLTLRIENSQLVEIIREGRKIYDPDGKLMREEMDEIVTADKIEDVIECLQEGYLIDIEQKKKESQSEYTFVVDGTDERTYDVRVLGTADHEGWDRFMNVE